MTVIEFSVQATPVAQPRQRTRIAYNGSKQFVANYTPSTHPIASYRKFVRFTAISAYAGPPLDGPCDLRVVFVLPRARSQIWKKRPMPRVPHVKKPDVDNLLKGLFDALTGVIWRDDRQIWRLYVEKWVAAGDEFPHVDIKISDDACNSY